MADKTVAIVDDEKDILEIVSSSLKKEGFKTKTFRDGREFMLSINSFRPDLILLDLMLPELDGIEICKRLKASSRTSSIPVIMITARATEFDIVLGLEIGADDYITKPFSTRELAARVKTVMRRGKKPDGGGADDDVIQIGSLAIDTGSFEAKVKGKPIRLTATQFRILEFLARNEGRVMSRDQILKQKSSLDDRLAYDRTVDVHVKNIRAKLAGSGVVIKTVRAVGYKLEKG
ncbi:MAG: response regulator transcription factor [Candidatus Dadabacteria bacterium]|nr:response regulator transcription factor [Candidatus Dadabacteria bacterium]